MSSRHHPYRTPTQGQSTSRRAGVLNSVGKAAASESGTLQRIRSRFDDFLNASESTVDDPSRDPTPLVAQQSLRHEASPYDRADDFRASRAEIVALQSRVADLESQVTRARSDAAVALLERDQARTTESLDDSQAATRLASLEKQRAYLADRDGETRARIAALEQELQQQKRAHSAQTGVLEGTVERLQVEAANAQSRARQLKAQLEHASETAARQQEIATDQLREREVELASARARAESAMARAAAADDLQQQLRASSHQVSQLRQQQDVLQRQLDQSQLQQPGTPMEKRGNKMASLAECERRLRRAQQENQYLQAKVENTELLLEQKAEVVAELERTRARCVELDAARLELAQLREMQSAFAGAESPRQLGLLVARTQRELAVALDESGQLRAQLTGSEAERSRLVNERDRARAELEQVRQGTASKGDGARLLERRLVFVRNERDGLRELLKSYEQEAAAMSDPSTYDGPRSEHFRLLEQQLQTASHDRDQLALRVEALQDQTDALTADLHEARDTTQSLESAIEQARAAIDTLERRVGRGEFNADTTQVLHLAENPLSMARAARAQQVKQLKEECQRLKEEVLAGAGNVDGAGTSGAAAIVSQELSALREQLSTAEVANQRLRTVFTQKINEFRTACYELTGYKIDMSAETDGTTYTLRSAYHDRSEDCLMFKRSGSALDVLETPFSASLPTTITACLSQFKSIPAFTSTITLDLFERVTRA